MASFGDQLSAARHAHLAARSLELTARQEILQTIDAWERGEYSAQSVRWRLEAIVRAAYRSAAAVASEHAVRQSGLPEWVPSEVFASDYLQALLSDVRRNLREYKASARQEVDRRRAVLRLQHSAGVAAQRGYTDATISAYSELEDFGFRLRKVWLANFRGNVPCEHCHALHGTEVGLNEEFPASSSLKVYGDLKGPPRHPRCQCYLAILIVSLANALEALDVERPGSAPMTLSTSDVKRMPGVVFRAIVATLKKIVARIRGAGDG